MSQSSRSSLPLVYSCSGASSAAQTANYLALKFDQENIAEMSCIAGVGGNVKVLVHLAKSGRDIIALDGCSIGCVKACLAQHKIEPSRHIVLSDFNIEKKLHEDFSLTEAEDVKGKVLQKIKEIPATVSV